jgi:PadR family transcriptional regulator
MPTRKLPLRDAPLKPQYFLVLLAVAEQPAHGYAIKQEVERRGGERLDPGSLYRVIARLLEERLIEDEDEPAAGADARRRCYRLTVHGRRTLAAEADRMASLVASVRRLAPARTRSRA